MIVTIKLICMSDSVVREMLSTAPRPGSLLVKLCRVHRCWRRRRQKRRTGRWSRLFAKRRRSQPRNVELLTHHRSMPRSLSDSGSLRPMLDVLRAAVPPRSSPWSQADCRGPFLRRCVNLVLLVPSCDIRRRSYGRWHGMLCATAAGRPSTSDEELGSVEVCVVLPDRLFRRTTTKPSPPTPLLTCRTPALLLQFTVHCRSAAGRWTSDAVRAARLFPMYRGRHRVRLCRLRQFTDLPSAPCGSPLQHLCSVEHACSLR